MNATLDDFMGSDGEGKCIGCRQPIDRFDPDCPVCVAVSVTIGEWGTDGVDPEVAGPRLHRALRTSRRRDRLALAAKREAREIERKRLLPDPLWQTH